MTMDLHPFDPTRPLFEGYQLISSPLTSTTTTMTCGICLEELATSSDQKRAKWYQPIHRSCGHEFHPECMQSLVDSWKRDLSNGLWPFRKCPICRFGIGGNQNWETDFVLHENSSTLWPFSSEDNDNEDQETKTYSYIVMDHHRMFNTSCSHFNHFRMVKADLNGIFIPFLEEEEEQPTTTTTTKTFQWIEMNSTRTRTRVLQEWTCTLNRGRMCEWYDQQSGAMLMFSELHSCDLQANGPETSQCGLYLQRVVMNDFVVNPHDQNNNHSFAETAAYGVLKISRVIALFHGGDGGAIEVLLEPYPGDDSKLDLFVAPCWENPSKLAKSKSVSLWIEAVSVLFPNNIFRGKINFWHDTFRQSVSLVSHSSCLGSIRAMVEYRRRTHCFQITLSRSPSPSPSPSSSPFLYGLGATRTSLRAHLHFLAETIIGQKLQSHVLLYGAGQALSNFHFLFVRLLKLNYDLYPHETMRQLFELKSPSNSTTSGYDLVDRYTLVCAFFMHVLDPLPCACIYQACLLLGRFDMFYELPPITTLALHQQVFQESFLVELLIYASEHVITIVLSQFLVQMAPSSSKEETKTWVDCNAVVTQGGRRLVGLAAQIGSSSMVRFLITHGADVSLKDDDGVSILYRAAWNGDRWGNDQIFEQVIEAWPPDHQANLEVELKVIQPGFGESVLQRLANMDAIRCQECLTGALLLL